MFDLFHSAGTASQTQGADATRKVFMLPLAALLDLIKAERGTLATSTDCDFSYVESYDSFLQHTDEYTAIHALLQDGLRSTFANAGDGSMNILEIGSGSGAFLQKLKDSPSWTKVQCYDAIEPNPVLAERLATCHSQDDVRIKKDMLSRGMYLEPRYDAVVSIHSVYYLSPKTDLVDIALSGLRPGGRILLVAREAVIANLEEKLRERLDASEDRIHVRTYPAMLQLPTRDKAKFESIIQVISGVKLAMLSADAQARLLSLCTANADEDGVCVCDKSFSVLTIETLCTPLCALRARLHDTDGSKLFLPFHQGYTSRLSSLKNPRTRALAASQSGPLGIAQPMSEQAVRVLVEWAYHNAVSLSVIGGGHSGHAVCGSNTLSVDLSKGFHWARFDPQTQIVTCGGGATSGVVSKSILGVALPDAQGVRDWRVPLGARPSVGAGLMLQGGMGHLSRLHGLTVDSLMGGRVVSLVPPFNVVDTDDDPELLWLLRGAGTNFGIVVQLRLQAVPSAPITVEQYGFDKPSHALLASYFSAASKLPKTCSADAYLYWPSADRSLTLALAVNSQGVPDDDEGLKARQQIMNDVQACAGQRAAHVSVECGATPLALYDMELYMSMEPDRVGSINGCVVPKHAKIDAFKRCVLMDAHQAAKASDLLLLMVQQAPNQLCYTHLVHCGGSVNAVDPSCTAFGCRKWEFAYVLTGVWLRDADPNQDGTAQRAAIEWVYTTAHSLLSFDPSAGAYPADLGPDPRDVPLARRAFGPNQDLLRAAKAIRDPRHVLANTCPLV